MRDQSLYIFPREIAEDLGVGYHEVLGMLERREIPHEPRDRKQGTRYRVLRAVYIAWKDKKVADGLRALGIEPAQAAQPEGVAA